jgi:hypothetical protein
LEETDEKTKLFRESAKVDGATALNVSVDIQSLIILDMNCFFLLQISDWKCCSLVI